MNYDIWLYTVIGILVLIIILLATVGQKIAYENAENQKVIRIKKLIGEIQRYRDLPELEDPTSAVEFDKAVTVQSFSTADMFLEDIFLSLAFELQMKYFEAKIVFQSEKFFLAKAWCNFFELERCQLSSDWTENWPLQLKEGIETFLNQGRLTYDALGKVGPKPKSVSYEYIKKLVAGAYTLRLTKIRPFRNGSYVGRDIENINFWLSKILYSDCAPQGASSAIKTYERNALTMPPIKAYDILMADLCELCGIDPPSKVEVTKAA